jgi:tRNA threonylcarbamoyladenosine biosynthesis protein TsaB
VLVLSLDTTTRAGSVAVVRDTDVLALIAGDASLTHGARLPGDLQRALQAAQVVLEAIDLLAVCAGPGSFTGLRVGISAMQGLAMAASRRVVPVSALDALSSAAADSSRPIAAWMDAQRGEVFAALYDEGGRRLLREPTALTPERTLEAWGEAIAGGRLRFVGDGAARYADLIRSRTGPDVEILDAPPLAGVIGRLAAASPERAVLPHAIVPIYIRRPDAEIAKERSLQ